MAMYIINTSSENFNPITIDNSRMLWKVEYGNAAKADGFVYVACPAKASACCVLGDLGFPRTYRPRPILWTEVPSDAVVYGLGGVVVDRPK